MSHLLQLGIEFGHVVLEDLVPEFRLTRGRVDDGIRCHEVHSTNHPDAFHGNAIVKLDAAAKASFPIHRQAVPPIAASFFFVDFGGVDTRNLNAIVLSVEVDFDEAVPDIVHLLIRDGLGGEVPRQSDPEKNATIVIDTICDVLQIKLENSPFEEKVNVFQIGLNVFVDGRSAVVVEVVLHLHFVVDENFAPAFGEHNFLLRGNRRAIANEVHRLLQIHEHLPDFCIILGSLVF